MIPRTWCLTLELASVASLEALLEWWKDLSADEALRSYHGSRLPLIRFPNLSPRAKPMVKVKPKHGMPVSLITHQRTTEPYDR